MTTRFTPRFSRAPRARRSAFVASCCALACALAGAACSRVAPDAVSSPAQAQSAPLTAPALPLADVTAAHADAPDVPSPAPQPTSTPSAAPAETLASTRRYKSVLLAGDSMVGVRCCLSRALDEKFRAEGARFFSDAWSNVTTATYDRDARFATLLRKTNPDLVLISLGTNDVFVPHPEALATNVASIAKKVGARDCYWIGPPTWRGDTGIVDVIRRHAAPCKFFDSSAMPLQRIRDGVHVTDDGGSDWAGRFWTAFRPAPPR